MSFQPSDVASAMIDAARAGGAIALKFYAANETIGMVEKAPRDYQLAADIATERAIAAVLNEKCPDAGIVGEEKTSDRAGDGRRTFIIDPIDGTSNFAFHIPFFAQVISHLEDGRVTAGVVFDPIRDEMFVAEAGRGAYLNGKRLPVCGDVLPERSVVGVGLPIPGQVQGISVERYHAALRAVIDRAAVTRRLGSAALSVAYVAAVGTTLVSKMGSTRSTISLLHCWSGSAEASSPTSRETSRMAMAQFSPACRRFNPGCLVCLGNDPV